MARLYYIFFVLVLTGFLSGETLGANMIKEPNVAGGFYTNDAEDLKALIASFMEVVPVSKENRNIDGIIVPHAGYIYSGPIAAHSFNEIKNSDYELAVVMAPSHYFNFNGAAVYKGRAFKTPLGNVLIDEESVEFVLSKEYFKNNSSVFEKEHALEVELPFLKYINPDIRILPIIFGQNSYESIKKAASILYELSKEKKIILVASSDLSHYLSYNDAVEMDSRTISLVKALKSKELMDKLSNKTSEACGYVPILVAMEYFKQKGSELEVLKYANSGDTAGDKSRVVGYASMVGFSTNEDELNLKEKKRLLELARENLKAYLQYGSELEIKYRLSDRMQEVCGAFVTLHKDGQLRGCIGNYGVEPLYRTVINMAIAAAVNDNRFPKVTLEELEEIDIEISALSPLRKVDSADDIILGKHGVIVKRGFSQGVFLPQVATETGWTKEEFLSYLCAHKAGLSPDAWKDPKTELMVFTADVFSEREILKD